MHSRGREIVGPCKSVVDASPAAIGSLVDVQLFDTGSAVADYLCYGPQLQKSDYRYAKLRLAVGHRLIIVMPSCDWQLATLIIMYFMYIIYKCCSDFTKQHYVIYDFEIYFLDLLLNECD